MNFIIDKSELFRNTHQLFGVVPTKNAMPILTNYLIEADKDTGKVKFTATDLELTVVVTFDASVTESGKATINAKLFNDVVANLPNTVLSFTREDDQLHVKYAKSKFNFLIADSSQFPIIPSQNLEDSISIDANLYKKMIHNTSFAVLQEGSKAVYNGIFWCLKKDYQLMASTDGTKIAEFKINKPTNIFEEEEIEAETEENKEVEEKVIKVILPLKSLSFLGKIIDKNSDEELHANIKPNRVIFGYKNFSIIANVLEGPYPDYTKAYPKTEQENNLLIQKDVMKSNVKRISLLASEDFLKIKFDFSSNQELKISAMNRELGNASELLSNIDYDGSDLSLSLNYRHFLAILDIIESEKVKIRMGSEKSPIMFYNEKENDDYSVKFLLMPLRRRR